MSLLAAVLGAAALALPATAGADTTLGITTQPTGSTAQTCTGTPSELIGQLTSDPSTPYMVPAAGGNITGWSIDTSGDTTGGTVTLWVLRPAGGSYQVVGADTETLPNPLPASGTASFTLATPMPAQAGDTFGLSATGATVNCFWHGGATPAGDSLFAAPAPPSTTPGQTVTPSGPTSGAGYTLNLGVTLGSVGPMVEDAQVTAAAGPANATAGYPAVLTDTVANGGSQTGPITLTDVVPAGLKIDSVIAGQGSCTTALQTVFCSVTDLAAGASTPVEIVVTPAAAQSYQNTVTVTPPAGITDPSLSNNTSAVTLAVGAVPHATPPRAAKCVVVSLKRAPARVARKLLVALHCKLGKVNKLTSKTIAKGDVIATRPGAGTYAGGRKIALTVSKGKAKPKHHHKPPKKHKHHRHPVQGHGQRPPWR